MTFYNSVSDPGSERDVLAAPSVSDSDKNMPTPAVPAPSPFPL